MDKFVNYVDHCDYVYIVANYQKGNIAYANRKAEEIYAVTLDTKDLEPIFQEHSQGLLAMYQTFLKDTGKQYVMVSDVVTLNKAGEKQLADISLGYFHKEEGEVFLEIHLKNDMRLEMAVHQVHCSQRAEAILNFDQRLTGVICNDLFHQILGSSEEARVNHYENQFANVLAPSMREQMLLDIHENLQKSTVYATRIKVITPEGEECWHSMELQRRTLDDSGTDKIMAYLVNIDNQLEMEQSYDKLHRHFLALQEMSDDILFAVNILENTMMFRYDGVEGAKEVFQQSPEGMITSGYVHPSDLDIYRKFVDSALSGGTGETVIRLLLPNDRLRHRKFIWRPVANHLGEITEVLGKMVDIEELVETQKELGEIQQYFDIFQSMSENLLYRFEIDSCTLHRNEKMASKHNFPLKEENFPSQEWLDNIMHPEDVQKMADYLYGLVQGKEGVLEARMRGISGECEYHSFDFRAVRHKDGSVKEMLGCARNIHKLKEAKEQLADVNQYFSIMQGLCSGLLYRFDVETRTLYRNEETAKKYNLPPISYDFPSKQWLDLVMTPEDHSGFIQFMDAVVAGEEGSHTARLRTAEGPFEYHKFTFKALRHGDGSIKEMVGSGMNVHNLRETQKELADTNEYFNVMQSLSDSLLYRYDLETATLHRNEEIAKRFNAPVEEKDFPSQAWFARYVHPEDVASLANYVGRIKSGEAGEYSARFIVEGGNYEYFSFIFKPMRRSDGTVKEMIICVKNIHNLTLAQQELDRVNLYFMLITEETEYLLLRYHIKSRMLLRNALVSKMQGIPSFQEDYPNEKEVARTVHPEDRADYWQFLNRLTRGEEGSINTRLITVEGTYEHHKVSFRAVKQEDGSVNEMLITVKNIHDLKETEQELATVHKHFDALQEMSEALLFRVDIKNKIFSSHGKKVGLFGMTHENAMFPEDMLNGGAIYPEDIWLYQEMAEKILSGEGGVAELRMRERENEDFGYRRITWVPVENALGGVTEVTGKLVDIQMLKILEEQANYDALTNLLNKRAILESASAVLKRSSKEEKHALFFMDLDDFKYVNDHLGHIFGDVLLKELGKRLRDCVRSVDMIGRVGGDEFIVFLRNIPNLEMLQGKAKMILSTISEDFVDGEIRHNIKGSLGIAVYPDHGSSYEELYHHADLALYESKRKGKNQVTLYQPEQ